MLDTGWGRFRKDRFPCNAVIELPKPRIMRATTNIAISYAAVCKIMPTMVSNEPQNIARRRPKRSAIIPDTRGPRDEPIKTEAVFRPLVVLFNVK
jgi:hypothetical protein